MLAGPVHVLGLANLQQQVKLLGEERVVVLEEIGPRCGVLDLAGLLAAPRGDGGDLDHLGAGGGRNDGAECDPGGPQNPQPQRFFSQATLLSL